MSYDRNTGQAEAMRRFFEDRQAIRDARDYQERHGQIIEAANDQERRAFQKAAPLDPGEDS